MKLVICEKNIAARRIAYILSKGKNRIERIGKIPVYDFTKDDEEWKIIGLKGHIINLDFPATYRRWQTNPPRELISVEPCKNISEKEIADALKILVKHNPDLVVATDFDREGELIGVEALDISKSYNSNLSKIKRARFSAITGHEIQTAFTDLLEVDYNLSDAGEARQRIDLIWGVVLTRFISLTSRRLGREFLSIGRVQSPTLALIVEREKAIKSFIPEPYWRIIARLKKDVLFNVTHIIERFTDETTAQDIFEKVKNAKEARIKEITIKKKEDFPPAPFSTTTFLQAASALRFSASNAMEIAERLYMAGLISYPRTDNTVYPTSLNIKHVLDRLRNTSLKEEVEEVITNGRGRPTRGKKKTTDHPPIHPVNSLNGNQLSIDEQKIYELICRRFLATLAKNAITESSKATIDISDELFIAQGFRIVEANWRKIYPYFKEARKPLPALIKDEILPITSIKLNREETKPPKRYSQGELLAKMESLMLGTKSTRHEIISKLYARKYLTGSPPQPTSTAIAVVESLTDCEVIQPKMTATLEEDMNAIADGKKTLKDTVEESRKMLTKVMIDLEKNKENIKSNIQQAHQEQNYMGKCPECGKTLIVRTSRRGKRFVGCTGYPECRTTYPLPQKGGIQVTEDICPECGTSIISVKNRGKKAWQLCLSQDCSSKKNSSNKN
jgi:DNA topoisomerase-1